MPLQIAATYTLTHALCAFFLTSSFTRAILAFCSCCVGAKERERMRKTCRAETAEGVIKKTNFGYFFLVFAPHFYIYCCLSENLYLNMYSIFRIFMRLLIAYTEKCHEVFFLCSSSAFFYISVARLLRCPICMAFTDRLHDLLCSSVLVYCNEVRLIHFECDGARTRSHTHFGISVLPFSTTQSHSYVVIVCVCGGGQKKRDSRFFPGYGPSSHAETPTINGS